MNKAKWGGPKPASRAGQLNFWCTEEGREGQERKCPLEPSEPRTINFIISLVSSDSEPRQQSGRTQAPLLHENTKTTTNCWATSNKIDWKLRKERSCIQSRTRRWQEGHFCIISNLIPARWATQRLEKKSQRFSRWHEISNRTSVSLAWRPGTEGASGASDVEGQPGLSADTPQDWGKQRL